MQLIAKGRYAPKKSMRGWLLSPFTAKIWLIMRITAFLLLGICLQLSAKTFSQKVSISVKDAPLETVFQKIKEQANYTFMYRNEWMQHAQAVTIDLTDASLEMVLKESFKGQPFTYSIIRQTVVIKQLPVNAIPEVPNNIQSLFRVIKGKVLDENNEPIHGATVLLKGSNQRATVTNSDGEFSINIGDAKQQTILISYVGYVQKEVKIGAEQQTVHVTLQLVDSKLEDVVVTGMFTRPKDGFTGAATTINADQIRAMNMINPLHALRILEPGLRIPDNLQFGSDPNKMPDLSLRGTNNIPYETRSNEIPSSGADFMSTYKSNPNQPLLILDGFQVSIKTINDLDINRIKSFTILKDAAATSMYGSRAANGVIVIETKEPEAGVLKMNYSGTLQVSAPDLTVYNLLNAREKLELEKNGGLFSSNAEGIRPDIDAQQRAIYARRKTWVEEGVNTYWLAQPVTTGIGQRHSVFLEGGDQSFRYGLNFGYNNNAGVMKNSGRESYSAAMKLSYRYKKLTFKNDMTITFGKGKNSNYGAFNDYVIQNPYWNPYDEQGNIKRVLETTFINNVTTIYTNPLFNASLHTINDENYSNISNSTHLEYRIKRGWNLRGSVTLQKNLERMDVFLPAQHTSFEKVAVYAQRGSYTKSNFEFLSVEASAYSDYSYRRDKHLFFNTTGINILQSGSESTIIHVEGFPNDKLDQILFGNAYPENSKPKGAYDRTRRFSAFSNFNYTHDSKYFADLNISSDGASQFGSDKRFGVFWSAGIGWNLHKEKMFEQNTNINELKIRATIGTVGENNFAPNQAITSYLFYTDQNYRGLVGSLLTGYGNNALKWQQATKKNIGVTAILFNNRLIAKADVYVSHVKDLILDITTAPSLGFSGYKENIGSLENKGYEFELRATILNKLSRQLNWAVFVNGSHNKGVLKSISNSLKKTNAENDKTDNNKQTSPRFRYVEGRSPNDIWAVVSKGIDPSTGRELFQKRDGSLTYIWDASDKQPVGNPLPKLNGSFGTDISWKSWALGAYFRYEYGGQLYNNTLISKVEDANINFQVDRRLYEGRWLRAGDITYYKGLVDINGIPISSKTMATSRFVQDNNFMNFESITISYQLPSSWNKKIKATNTRLTAIFNDIARFSSIDIERGTAYPFARNFTLSLSTTF